MSGRGWHRIRVNSRRWEGVRRRALEAAGYRCSDCGKAGRLEAHHVVPVHQDPSLMYELSNIKPLCYQCHRDTHAKPVDPDVQAWDELLESMV